MSLEKFKQAYERLQEGQRNLAELSMLYSHLIFNLGGMVDFLKPLSPEKQLPIFKLLIEFHTANSDKLDYPDHAHIACIRRYYFSSLKRNRPLQEAEKEGGQALSTLQRAIVHALDAAVTSYGVALPSEYLAVKKSLFNEPFSLTTATGLAAVIRYAKGKEIFFDDDFSGIIEHFLKALIDSCRLAELLMRYKEASQLGECVLILAQAVGDVILLELGRGTLFELYSDVGRYYLACNNSARVNELQKKAEEHMKEGDVPLIRFDVLRQLYEIPPYKYAADTDQRSDIYIECFSSITDTLKKRAISSKESSSTDVATLTMHAIEAAKRSLLLEEKLNQQPDYEVTLVKLNTEVAPHLLKESDPEPEINVQLAKLYQLTGYCYAKLNQIDEAMNHYKHARRLSMNLYGDNHDDVLKVNNCLTELATKSKAIALDRSHPNPTVFQPGQDTMLARMAESALQVTNFSTLK